MPVLGLFTGKITKDQYDVIRAELDWEHNHPAGGVFHAASFDDDGTAHVADVWESAEELNAFAQKGSDAGICKAWYRAAFSRGLSGAQSHRLLQHR